MPNKRTKRILFLFLLLSPWSLAIAYNKLPNGGVTDGEILNQKQTVKEDAFANAPPYAKSLCTSPKFQCYRINTSVTWRKLFPNVEQRDIEMRLNRTNIPLNYKSWMVQLKSWKDVTYMSLSPFPTHIKTNKHKLVIIDLKRYAFAAYNRSGDLVKWGPAASGKAWCDDTKETCQTKVGTFRVYRKKGEDCKSGSYPVETHGGSPMPYCMYFYRGLAIHGSTLSGFNNRSRGCIRLFNEDAEWLNKDFVRIGTTVVVK